MTQEVDFSSLISVISVVFAIWVGVTNIKRNDKRDNTNQTAELTTVIVKLENIGAGVSEIKSEMSSMRNDQKDTREKVIELDSAVKNVCERLDRCERECKLVKETHLS